MVGCVDAGADRAGGVICDHCERGASMVHFIFIFTSDDLRSLGAWKPWQLYEADFRPPLNTLMGRRIRIRILYISPFFISWFAYTRYPHRL